MSRWLHADAAWGLVLVALVLVLHLTTGFVRTLQNQLDDWAKQATGRQPSDRVVVVAIDEASIARMGRWPWSREVHATVLERLQSAQLVVSTVLMSEPQIDRGVPYLQSIRRTLLQADGSQPSVADALSQTDAALKSLDADGALAAGLARSGRVVLPALMTTGDSVARAGKSEPRPDIPGLMPPLPGVDPVRVSGGEWPLPPFARAARAVGHLNQEPEPDGVLRSDPLFLSLGDAWVPSLALAAATQALNLSPKDRIQVLDGALKLGRWSVPLDESGRVWPQYYPAPPGAASAFPTDSFFDVWSGKVSPDRYAGKLVLIGATAPGIGTTFVTPASNATYAVHVLAHNTSSMLQGHFFARPAWSAGVTLAMLLGVAVLVAWGLPLLSAAGSAVVTGAVGLSLLSGGVAAVAWGHLMVDTVLPLLALIVAYLGLTTRRFLFTEAGKIRADEESAETNRLMGLALQGQGQLDMAFDRFRRVPFSDALLDNLFNLALDFERKRQFNKAQAVYEHMATHNPHYKDLPVRLQRMRSLAETVVLGDAGPRRDTLVVDQAGVAKPMLGRYHVEKELGKGAMGVVYLGRDPTIGRVVAIKTLALSQSFEAHELNYVRERFFREAETAGRLQHPHIVTIYDAGEDQDLAYIAMEYLRGQDLTPHTRPGQLLDLARVLSIGVQVADALHYAHGLHVVHRDIKPANIMYEPASDTVKVTDFGIARITDASRTRTGMVLGTPSFMSPEQIAGQKVDGRSDLYSLGVTLFQLLSGRLPFLAESMAELMFKIANEPPPDVRAVNPEVPASVAAVVKRAMAKDRAVRFETGQAMAEALRQAAAELGERREPL